MSGNYRGSAPEGHSLPLLSGASVHVTGEPRRSGEDPTLTTAERVEAYRELLGDRRGSEVDADATPKRRNARNAF